MAYCLLHPGRHFVIRCRCLGRLVRTLRSVRRPLHTDMTSLGIMWSLGAHFGGCVETKITFKVIVYLVVYTVGLRIWRSYGRLERIFWWICGDDVVDLGLYIVVYIVSLRLCPCPHQQSRGISALGVSTTATIGLGLETAVLMMGEAGKAAGPLATCSIIPLNQPLPGVCGHGHIYLTSPAAPLLRSSPFGTTRVCPPRLLTERL
jgi:hypothetical protein